jgi:hypothetical protein
MSTERIAQLNDAFRRSFLGGRVLATAGISSLPDADRAAIFAKVQAFAAFTEDNDPHGERDFGALDHPGAGRIFWKIDYYAPDMLHGSEDPADPSRTVRVLTIMLAAEY